MKSVEYEEELVHDVNILADDEVGQAAAGEARSENPEGPAGEKSPQVEAEKKKDVDRQALPEEGTQEQGEGVQIGEQVEGEKSEVRVQMVQGPGQALLAEGYS